MTQTAAVSEFNLNQDIDFDLLKRVEQFLYLEARLSDERLYRDWLSLWTDDGLYWVPANSADIDPEKEMSIIYDNRSRIELRVNQFYTGKRFMAKPGSSVRRVVSNVEILSDDGVEIQVASNAIIYESAQRQDTVWGCRNEYKLRRVDGLLKIAYKKVVLVNCDKAVGNLTFLV